MISPIVNPDSIYFPLTTRFFYPYGWSQFGLHQSGVLCKHTVPYSEAEALACQFHGKRVTCVTQVCLNGCYPTEARNPWTNHGYLDTSSKSVKSLNCPGHPWNYGYNYFLFSSRFPGPSCFHDLNIIQSHNAVEALAPVIFLNSRVRVHACRC